MATLPYYTILSSVFTLKILFLSLAFTYALRYIDDDSPSVMLQEAKQLHTQRERGIIGRNYYDSISIESDNEKDQIETVDPPVVTSKVSVESPILTRPRTYSESHVDVISKREDLESGTESLPPLLVGTLRELSNESLSHHQSQSMSSELEKEGNVVKSSPVAPGVESSKKQSPNARRRSMSLSDYSSDCSDNVVPDIAESVKVFVWQYPMC